MNKVDSLYKHDYTNTYVVNNIIVDKAVDCGDKSNENNKNRENDVNKVVNSVEI